MTEETRYKKQGYKQAPNNKSQITNKFKITMTKIQKSFIKLYTSFEFGIWSLFGIWCLKFVICL
jgi:hypothetical protein